MHRYHHALMMSIILDTMKTTCKSTSVLDMKVHRFVPSHRTGGVEMMVNSSMNSRGNGRPMLNRFVLDKSHLRMRHDMWFSTFSGSLHSARSFCQVSMTVEDVFVENNVC